MSESTPSVRVFHGLRSSSVATLQGSEASRDEEAENRYLEQVREKAREKARDIMAQALAEAEQVREQARDEGFAAGWAEAESRARTQAQAEADARIQIETEKIAAFLCGLEQALLGEKERIFATHRDALFQVLRLSFEKTLGVVLDAGREQILTGLFEEAVGQLQAGSAVTVYVSPDDLDLAGDLVRKAQDARPDSPACTLRPDPTLELGGVRLESGDGLVDNSISSRLDQVRTILDGGAP